MTGSMFHGLPLSEGTITTNLENEIDDSYVTALYA